MMLAVLLLFVVIVLSSVIIAILRYIWLKNHTQKKDTAITNFKSVEDCIDEDIPFNGPDFINRFETDPWDLRI